MSRPPSRTSSAEDVDWVTYHTLQQGRYRCGDPTSMGSLATLVGSFSSLHVVCLCLLVMVLADVAVTAWPTVGHATWRLLYALPRGEKARLERRVRLRETIADHTRTGDYRSAIELTTALVADLKSELNSANAAGAVNVLEAGDTLAGLHLLQGDPARAESLYRQHLEILETTRTPSSWAGAGVPEVLCKLGGVRAARGDDAEAESLYRRALTMCDAYSPDHPFTCEILNELAVVCRRTDRDAEARAFEARARSIREGRENRGPDGSPRP